MCGEDFLKSLGQEGDLVLPRRYAVPAIARLELFEFGIADPAVDLDLVAGEGHGLRPAVIRKYAAAVGFEDYRLDGLGKLTLDSGIGLPGILQVQHTHDHKYAQGKDNQVENVKNHSYPVVRILSAFCHHLTLFAGRVASLRSDPMLINLFSTSVRLVAFESSKVSTVIVSCCALIVNLFL